MKRSCKHASALEANPISQRIKLNCVDGIRRALCYKICRRPAIGAVYNDGNGVTFIKDRLENLYPASLAIERSATTFTYARKQVETNSPDPTRRQIRLSMPYTGSLKRRRTPFISVPPALYAGPDLETSGCAYSGG